MTTNNVPFVQLPGSATMADGAALEDAGSVAARATHYNGATWDLTRGNVERTVLASAQRTASVNSADVTNHNARGLVVVIDVTSINAVTPSITVTIQGKDPVSGVYYTLLASAAITTVSTTVLEVRPGLTAAANSIANKQVPRTYRVSVAHGDADAIDYSIGAVECV